MIRVAYSYEPCWHRVPGGTAMSALRTATALLDRDDVALVGFAARHLRSPSPPFQPVSPVSQLRLPSRVLYESWHRRGRPPVETATGPVDVIHGTGGVTPPRTAPLVVTVHDMAVYRYPEYFTANGRRFLRAALDAARDRADLVLCPSEATRADCEVFGFDPGRLRVVPWGVDTEVADDAAVARVRRQYRLPETFLLFVGTAEPRKNLDMLVRALSRARNVPPLVIAGPGGWGDVGLGPNDCLQLGFVPQDDLGALYRAAAAFVYPSLLEGFGMPVLEAMAQGTPVVTTAGTATDELVVDGGGMTANVDSASSILRAINDVLADRDDLSAEARQIAATYSWERTAALTVGAYREALG